MTALAALPTIVKTSETRWHSICPLESILPFTGVAALVDGKQIAIFRLPDSKVYAISNFDPFSNAFVISRGIVGDRNGELKVASPIYKHNFNLITGQCFDLPSVVLPVWSARVVNDFVQVKC